MSDEAGGCNGMLAWADALEVRLQKVCVKHADKHRRPAIDADRVGKQ